MSNNKPQFSYQHRWNSISSLHPLDSVHWEFKSKCQKVTTGQQGQLFNIPSEIVFWSVDVGYSYQWIHSDVNLPVSRIRKRSRCILYLGHYRATYHTPKPFSVFFSTDVGNCYVHVVVFIGPRTHANKLDLCKQNDDHIDIAKTL